MPKKRIYYKGKKVSKGEKKIIDHLLKREISFEQEKTFDDCKTRNNRKHLRFDFFLPTFKVLIEFDGEHHYGPVNKHARAKYVHERTVINDQIKNNYVTTTGYGLLRIPYWEYDKIEEIIDEMISNLGNK
jgi:very-short-patch-repair endonuclease